MLSTVWNTQRDSQSYIKKSRGRNEIEVTRWRRGVIKRIVTDLASNQFPVFFTDHNTQRDSQSWVEKRRGRKEIKVTWGRKRRIKRGRR